MPRHLALQADRSLVDHCCSVMRAVQMCSLNPRLHPFSSRLTGCVRTTRSLTMKINAKLGGRNMKLEGPPRNSYPGGIDARPFMVLGALPSIWTVLTRRRGSTERMA